MARKDVFKELNWDEKGINIDDTRLGHLRFADDKVVIANITNEMLEMLTSGMGSL